MAPSRENLTGRRFGRYVVVGFDRSDRRGQTRWVCDCDCGSRRDVPRTALVSGRAKSCGCSIKLKSRETLADRLNAMYIPEPNSGCWLWIGALSKDGGYGQISVDGKMRKAHRMMYEMHRARIPQGMEACHTCDNPCCVNPDHLFAGSHLDNMADRERKRRRTAPRGSKHAGSKLDESQVLEIRNLIGTKTYKEIADCYGVHKSLIYLINKGSKWAHIR